MRNIYRRIICSCTELFADLNGLKHVNDVKGHGAGDQLLKTAAAILRGVFYDSEIYRAGGDEFMIIVEGLKENEISTRLERLRELSSSVIRKIRIRNTGDLYSVIQ